MSGSNLTEGGGGGWKTPLSAALGGKSPVLLGLTIRNLRINVTFRNSLVHQEQIL